jgi:hypothetical protein
MLARALHPGALPPDPPGKVLARALHPAATLAGRTPSRTAPRRAAHHAELAPASIEIS